LKILNDPISNSQRGDVKSPTLLHDKSQSPMSEVVMDALMTLILEKCLTHPIFEAFTHSVITYFQIWKKSSQGEYF